MRYAGGGAPRAKTIYALVLVLLLVVLVGWYCYFVGAKVERDALLRGHPDFVARWEVDEIIEVGAKAKCAALVEAERLLGLREGMETHNKCQEQEKQVDDLVVEVGRLKQAVTEAQQLAKANNQNSSSSSWSSSTTTTDGADQDQDPDSEPESSLGDVGASPPHTKGQDEVVVVMWDNSWGNPYYWGAGDVIPPPNYAGFEIRKPQCPTKCTFTRDKSMVTVADALLFDGCWYGANLEWKERPPYMPERREGQPWIMYAYEQPNSFSLLAHKEYLELFDHKMTFANDSLVQITYMCPWGSKTPADLLKPPPAKTKDKLVAFISSNCNGGGAVARTAYVEELMEHIQVDSFGLCLHNADLPEGKGWHDSFGNLMEIKMRAISEYKFFLAFENDDQVADYVTEKMLNALYAGTVPVYRGAPNIGDWVPGENSIIDTRDFASPKELADFLLRLNEDDEAYNRYFEWKKSPWPPRFQTLLDNCVFFAECRLCQALAGARGDLAAAPAMNATLVPKGSIDAFSLEFNRVDTRIKLTDDSVVVPTSRSLELEDNYTLMAWINLNMINDGRIIDKASVGKIDGYAFDVRHASEGRGVVRLCAADSCFTGARRLLRGVWYHVAVTFRNADEGVRFYINGRLDKVATPSAPTANNSYPIKIGHPSNHYNGWRTVHKGGVFDGLIDDVAIFNRVLSLQDIRDLRYRRISGKETGLAAYWGFNEGEGRKVHDASPHRNDGTIYGSPRWVPTVTKPLFEETLVETM